MSNYFPYNYRYSDTSVIELKLTKITIEIITLFAKFDQTDRAKQSTRYTRLLPRKRFADITITYVLSRRVPKANSNGRSCSLAVDYTPLERSLDRPRAIPTGIAVATVDCRSVVTVRFVCGLDLKLRNTDEEGKAGGTREKMQTFMMLGFNAIEFVVLNIRRKDYCIKTGLWTLLSLTIETVVRSDMIIWRRIFLR